MKLTSATFRDQIRLGNDVTGHVIVGNKRVESLEMGPGYLTVIVQGKTWLVPMSNVITMEPVAPAAPAKAK